MLFLRCVKKRRSNKTISKKIKAFKLLVKWQSVTCIIFNRSQLFLKNKTRKNNFAFTAWRYIQKLCIEGKLLGYTELYHVWLKVTLWHLASHLFLCFWKEDRKYLVKWQSVTCIIFNRSQLLKNKTRKNNFEFTAWRYIQKLCIEGKLLGYTELYHVWLKVTWWHMVSHLFLGFWKEG